MKKPIAKYVWKCLLWLLIVFMCVAIFVAFLLPGFTKDRQQLIDDEMLKHNETLNAIIADFSSVLTFDNVNSNIRGDEIEINISGDACDLNVTLNKKLQVVNLTTIDNTERDIIFLALGSSLLIVVIVLSVVRIWKNVENLKCGVKANKESDAALKEIEADEKHILV